MLDTHTLSQLVLVLVSMAAAYWQSVPSTFWSSALHYWKATQGPAPKQEQKVPAAPAQMSSPASMPDELLRSVLQVVESRCVATSAVVCRRWRTLCGGRFGDVCSSADESSSLIEHLLFSGDFSAVDAQIVRSRGQLCASSPPDGTSWKLFYSQYAVSWLQRALVGANIEGEKVYLGLSGGLYDVTGFCRQHPGSPETLLDMAGSDATGIFEDVGHSTVARRLAASMLLVAAPRTGALATVKAHIDAAKQYVANTAPHACPTCSSNAFACRPFFDASTAYWLGWWPCCGLVHTPFEQPPPNLCQTARGLPRFSCWLTAAGWARPS